MPTWINPEDVVESPQSPPTSGSRRQWVNPEDVEAPVGPQGTTSPTASSGVAPSASSSPEGFKFDLMADVQKQTGTPEEISATSNDAMVSAIHPVSRLTRGVARLAMPKSVEDSLGLDTWQSKDEALIQEARKRSPYASFIGQAAGEAALATAAGGARALEATASIKEVGKAMLEQGGRMGTLGFLSGDNMTERGINAGIGVLGGAAGPVIGKAAGMLNQGFNYMKSAVGYGDDKLMSNAAVDIAKAGSRTVEKTKESLGAAQRLGVFESPAEASRLPTLAADEANMNLPRAVRGDLQAKLMQRQEKFADVMNQTALKILPGDESVKFYAQKAQALYKTAGPTKLGGENVQKLLQNKQVVDAYEHVVKEGQLPPNAEPTVESLLEVRAYLASSNKAAREAMRLGNATDYDEKLGVAALNKVTDILRNVSPEANEALNLSQKIIIRNALVKGKDKIKGGVTMDKIYKTFGSSTEKRMEFLSELRAGGVDPRPMADVMTILEDISMAKDPLLKATTRQASSGDIFTGTLKYIKSQLTGDVLEEMATNNKWQDSLKNIKATKSAIERVQKFGDLITKVGASMGADRINQGGQ